MNCLDIVLICFLRNTFKKIWRRLCCDNTPAPVFVFILFQPLSRTTLHSFLRHSIYRLALNLKSEVDFNINHVIVML